MKRGIQHNTHPGEYLKEDILDEYGLTVSKAAELLDVSRVTLSNIINEKASVTPNIALRIAAVFGGNPDFWLRLQLAYDLREAEEQFKNKPPKVQRFEPSAQS